VVLHLVQNFNKIAAFIIKDKDGPQTKDLVFILERVRRSLSVLKIFKAKKDPARFKSSVSNILEYLNGVLDGISSGGGAARAGTS